MGMSDSAVLKRLNLMERRIHERIDAVGSDVADLRVGQGKLTQKVDDHAAHQTTEHGDVKHDVAHLQKDVVILKTSAAITRTKMGLFGVGGGAGLVALFEAIKQAFHVGPS